MGRQLLKLNQISGINNPALQEDLMELLSKVKYFNMPVATLKDLPLKGIVDGEIRIVIDEEAIYVWHEVAGVWRTKRTISTERRMTNIVVNSDNPVDFTTALQIGVANGIASLDSVVLMVNGLTQYPGGDYTLSEDNQVPPRLKVGWKSQDFQLEQGDVVAILYDILKII